MSYTIVYRTDVRCVSADSLGMDEDQFFVLNQLGSSNVYSQNGQRAREWVCLYAGGMKRVMQTATRHSADFETQYIMGATQFGEPKGVKPELYLRRLRNSMRAEQQSNRLDAMPQEIISLLEFSAESPVPEVAMRDGWRTEVFTRWNEKYIRLVREEQTISDILRLLSNFEFALGASWFRVRMRD